MSQRTMTETKCTTCGKTTMVPFKPTAGKPVYCRECFTKRNTTTTPQGNVVRKDSFEPKQAWARRRDQGHTKKEGGKSRGFQKFSHAPE